MPKTTLGKWSAICLGLFVLFLIIGQIVVATGQQGGDTFFDNLYISIPMSLAALAAVFAFILGITSLIKSKERSPLVIIATVIGLVIIVFLAGEFLGPQH
jgi:hypothetical protein